MQNGKRTRTAIAATIAAGARRTQMNTDKTYSDLVRAVPKLKYAETTLAQDEQAGELFRSVIVVAYFLGKVDSDLERIAKAG